MPSMKKDLDPEFATRVAADFLKKTADLYERCELAGSLRRKEPVVHDIDFAVIPKGDDFAKWKDLVTKRVVKIGGRVITFGEVISDFFYKGVQVNLFLCPGPDSWGVTLMWATGPKGHTIGMTIKARNKGLLINSRGIWTRKEPPSLVPARTEQEVGKLLDWKYKPPETRGKDTKEKPVFY
jgi:DNA polymerase/3'-5' exonuclease PolX